MNQSSTQFESAENLLDIVYVTSGIDELVTVFHTLPGNTIAIVEITDRSFTDKLKLNVRSIIGMLMPKRYPSLSRYCRSNGIKHIEYPKHRRAELKNTIENLQVDLLVSYRSPFLPMEAINAARLGGINVHFSVLPDFRGGDPLLWQVLHGVENVGVTVHKLTDKIDYGVMLEQDTARRPLNLTRTELRKFINHNLSQRLLGSAIDQLQNGNAQWQEQIEKADPIPAPNKPPQFWREYVQQHNLDESRVNDIACFVGQRQKS